MTVTAIIAEYNPFHNGHLYQIRRAKELTGCSQIIAVMSSNFVQRGEPAVMDKFDRAYCALAGGLDAVFELPIHISTASAEGFASGALSLLNGLGCVDYLCFGSECGNLTLLDRIAQILARPSASFSALLKSDLKSGLSFPAARENALWNLIQNHPCDSLQLASFFPDRSSFSAFLSMPNNILGIEYLKAIKKSGSTIRPVTLQRTDRGYHDLCLSPLCSASAIRNLLTKESCLPDAGNAMPDEAWAVIKKHYHVTCPVHMEDFSAMLRYRLLMFSDWRDLCAFADVPEDLARRIFSMKSFYRGYNLFVHDLKTRNYTESSIRRALLHILLDIRKDVPADHKPSALFARLLGMRKGSPVLSVIKKNSRLPVISKPADAHSLFSQYYSQQPDLNRRARNQFSDTVRSSELFRGAVCEKFHTDAYSEYRQSPVIFSPH